MPSQARFVWHVAYVAVRAPDSGASMRQHFMTASLAECACVSCPQLHPLRRRKPDAADWCIGYQSAVALSSPMLQITTNVPTSNIIIGLTLESIKI